MTLTPERLTELRSDLEHVRQTRPAIHVFTDTMDALLTAAETAEELRRENERLTKERDALYGILFGDGDLRPIDWVAAMRTDFMSNDANYAEDPAASVEASQEVGAMVDAARKFFAEHPELSPSTEGA